MFWAMSSEMRLIRKKSCNGMEILSINDLEVEFKGKNKIIKFINPGLAIILLVSLFNVLGDVLRNALDPKEVI